MDFEEIRARLDGFPDTRMIEAGGDFFAVYDPDRDYEQRPRQGWATLVQSDAHDTVSDLSRAGMYRLNIACRGGTSRNLLMRRPTTTSPAPTS